MHGPLRMLRTGGQISELVQLSESGEEQSVVFVVPADEFEALRVAEAGEEWRLWVVEGQCSWVGASERRQPRQRRRHPVARSGGGVRPVIFNSNNSITFRYAWSTRCTR